MKCDEIAFEEVETMYESISAYADVLFCPDFDISSPYNVVRKLLSVGLMVAQINIALVSLYDNKLIDEAENEKTKSHPDARLRMRQCFEKDQYLFFDDAYVFFMLYLVIIYKMDLKKFVKKHKFYKDVVLDMIEQIDFGRTDIIFGDKICKTEKNDERM